MKQGEICLSGDEHTREEAVEYPSVPLLCLPMSQSIFIPWPRSPGDLQGPSLLIPSASSLRQHYEPHIYLIRLPARTQERALYSHVRICECINLTLASKMSECKISLVTYLVSCLSMRPAGADGIRGRCVFCRPSTRSSRGSEGLELTFSILSILCLFFLATTAAIYRPRCYFALYLGFSPVCFTGRV